MLHCIILMHSFTPSKNTGVTVHIHKVYSTHKWPNIQHWVRYFLLLSTSSSFLLRYDNCDRGRGRTDAEADVRVEGWSKRTRERISSRWKPGGARSQFQPPSRLFQCFVFWTYESRRLTHKIGSPSSLLESNSQAPTACAPMPIARFRFLRASRSAKHV